MREAVVLVHGIWSYGVDLPVLRYRLSKRGFHVRLFRHPSLLRSPRENATELARFLGRIDAEVLHLVAHSLGGIVVLHLFDLGGVERPGRVVMLGSPLAGSRVAHRVARWPLLGRLLLGRSVEQGLLGDAPRWKGHRELGLIAGSRGVGAGTLTGGLDVTNDGAVAVDETEIPGAPHHELVPYGHFGMLQSRRVAELVARFLATGNFDSEPSGI